MKLHSGRAGSITRRGVRTHPSSSTLSLCLQHSAVTHTVILERKRSGGDVEVEEFIHIQLQQRGKPALENASASLMSLHLALRSLITQLGHPFFFFFCRRVPQIQEEHVFRHHQWGSNVHFQKPAGTGASKANWMQRCCVMTANPSLRDWTPAFVLFRYKDPYPPPPSFHPSPVIDFPESLDAEPETVSHRKAADRVN